jgi:two-component system LytT family response regulator
MTGDRQIRALIVDDEPLARRRIRKLLAEHADIEVIGECANGLEAIGSIRDDAPDLVFLDVQMPEVNGFEVLEAAKMGALPLTIFVTAYDSYAIRAFEVHALDYLLKPFDKGRFDRAVQRARDHMKNDRGARLARQTVALLQELRGRTQCLERLVIKSASRIFFLKTSEIDWVEAEGKYVRIHVGKESHLLRQAIGDLEGQLDPKQFFRIHRSTIVNADRIRELQPWFNREYRVVLHDGAELTLSRGYRKKLVAVLRTAL